MIQMTAVVVVPVGVAQALSQWLGLMLVVLIEHKLLAQEEVELRKTFEEVV